jgi:lysophospholipase L1-like esterase
MSLNLHHAMLPLLLAQGLWAKARTPHLPEPAGEREGEVGDAPGPPVRLLIVGDSSAAGVGVDHVRDGFAGQFSAHLAQRARRRVRWQLVARSGATALDALALLTASAAAPADLAVVVLGVNDVVDRVPIDRAVAARAALADALLQGHGVRHVGFSALPPIDCCIALPQPLRQAAGAEARRYDAAFKAWADAREAACGDVSWLPMPLPLEREHLAIDGFHPSAVGYRVCCGVLAEALAPRVPLTGPACDCKPGAGAGPDIA